MGIGIAVIVIVVVFAVMNKATREKIIKEFKQVWVILLDIGIILILVFFGFLIRKNILRSSIVKIDEDYWRIVHIEQFQDVTRATRIEKIDEDDLSDNYMLIEGVMDDVREYGVKKAKYSNQEKFLEHFDNVYPEKTHMYAYLIIGIVLIVVAILVRRTKKFLIELHKPEEKGDEK
ncbi:MAG: hypothetical protein IJ867_06495 [Clostridia bacterium]|nr:hypothetical protein [Clostridia bacterium]